LLNQDPPRPRLEGAVQHEQCFVISNQKQPGQTSTTPHPKPGGNSYFVLLTLSRPQSGQPDDSIKAPFQIDSAASCNTLPAKYLVDIPWAHLEPLNAVLQPYAGDDDDDDKLYLTTLTLSAEAGFHNGRVKNINKLLQVE
jgi:hypothetical protein